MPVPLAATDAPMDLSSIIFGGGALGTSYNSLENVQYNAPGAIITAFRNGINAIDTSPFYINSEDVIGHVLDSPEFRNEFPRESYYLITKTGRFGHKRKHFDYSRSRIIESVKKSCEKLKTSYLDAVYLHDVEFVAEDVGKISSRKGNPLDVLNDQQLLEQAGLSSGYDKIHGKGDNNVLEAIGALFELKEMGIVRRVGISGYPLPTILRIARLVRENIGKPLDIVLSYCHQYMQNSTLLSYIPHLRDAGVKQIVNASPLGMGLLTGNGPHAWHPAPPELRETVCEAGKLCSEAGTTLERVALYNGLEPSDKSTGTILSTAVGMVTSKEVEEAIQLLDLVHTERDLYTQLTIKIDDLFKKSGYHNWSWDSPPPNA